MKPNIRIAVGLLTIFLCSATATSWALYRDLLRDDCGLREELAKSLVIEDLRARGLADYPLRPRGRTGRCRYDYRYDHAGMRIDYAVHGDWIDGAVLTFREHTPEH